MNDKKIVLFVNDSIYSYLLSKQLINTHHDKIALIIFSEGTTSSFKKIFSIFNKASKKYFFYRVFVQILSKILYKNKSVSYLSDQYNIDKYYVNNTNAIIDRIDENRVAFAFNFDLIVSRNVLNKFKNGVFNIHASKLPKDKGISPVLWAFARGDNTIWSTIYKMDAGIDTGLILKQFPIKIKKDDTSFSLYERVCIESGSELSGLINKIITGNITLSKQEDNVSNYFSWPDKKFSLMMQKSNRKLIKFRDIINFTKNEHNLTLTREDKENKV
jgi:folate-dependent phosphoribosylglycinamide formyltransferase PurN